jgi:hypothetical protein
MITVDFKSEGLDWVRAALGRDNKFFTVYSIKKGIGAGAALNLPLPPHSLQHCFAGIPYCTVGVSLTPL